MHHHTAEQWLGLVRAHWGGVEIRNHWAKDHCYREDATPSRRTGIVCSLAMLRNAALVFYDSNRENHASLNDFIETVAADKAFAHDLVVNDL